MFLVPGCLCKSEALRHAVPFIRALAVTRKWTLAIRKAAKGNMHACVWMGGASVREKDSGLEVRGSGGLRW